MNAVKRFFCLGVYMLASTLAADVYAAAFSIAPTKVQLSPSDTADSLTLTNNADSAVTVQVETFAWKRTESIADLDPTRDVIAVPPFFDIGPGEKQIIRIGLRHLHESDTETAYRLVLSEVPNEAADTGLGVQFALRLSLPIFITPHGAKPEAQWRVSESGDGMQVNVENRGQAHLRLFSLKITDPGHNRLLGESSQPAYLLAGQVREMPIEIDGHAPNEVLISAETSEGPMEIVRIVER